MCMCVAHRICKISLRKERIFYISIFLVVFLQFVIQMIQNQNELRILQIFYTQIHTLVFFILLLLLTTISFGRFICVIGWEKWHQFECFYNLLSIRWFGTVYQKLVYIHFEFMCSPFRLSFSYVCVCRCECPLSFCFAVVVQMFDDA